MDDQATQKLLSLLGITRRAGKLSLGADAVKEAVRGKTAKLILYSSDVSEGTAGSVANVAGETPAVRLFVPMERIGAALGVKRVGVLAALDAGFAQKMLQLAHETMTGRNVP